MLKYLFIVEFFLVFVIFLPLNMKIWITTYSDDKIFSWNYLVITNEINKVGLMSSSWDMSNGTVILEVIRYKFRFNKYVRNKLRQINLA